MKKKSLYSMIIILVLLVGSMIFMFSQKADAKENERPVEPKYYTSILIEEGDSLWSIAEEYKPDDTVTVKKYIKELKKMNNISSDTIHAGNYLTIYYYKN